VHEVNSNHSERGPSHALSLKREESSSLVAGKCYLFGQSQGERKVVCFNAANHQFTSLSSRIRIPIPKIKLEPIEKLYEESQEVILPELMEKTPSPPFNSMFATFCRNELIFLCGGINYEEDEAVASAFLYNLKPEPVPPQKNKIANNSPTTKTYIKFESIEPMSMARYSHMGLYFCDASSKAEFVYVFGGKDGKHESQSSCERYDLRSSTHPATQKNGSPGAQCSPREQKDTRWSLKD
jgi:hypothetical protein